MSDVLNRAGIRESVRTITGYPERGDTGKVRINNAINLALRRMWKDIPTKLIEREFRIQLQPAIETTVDVDSVDSRVMVLSANTATLNVNGEHDARWVDITDSDGQIHTLRIQEVWRTGGFDHFTIDRPWPNATDAGLTARIYTKTYPMPHDIRRVRSVIRDPETAPFELLDSTGSEGMDRWRIGRWNDSGTPQMLAQGETMNIPAPRYTPGASLFTDPNTRQWGFDDAGIPVERPQYEQPGTFEYRVCHVWGRRPFFDGQVVLGGESRGLTVGGDRLPFLISAPSPPTEAKTTFWGNIGAASACVKLTLPDIDAYMGYAPDPPVVGNNPTSDNRSGLEKWIFRRRISSNTDGSDTSDFGATPSDSVYYLWQIVAGHITSIFDCGQHQPDHNFPLEDFHGHLSVQLDVTPTSEMTLFIRGEKRPARMAHDNDVAVLPPDCHDALFYLVCHYLVGLREGEPLKAAQYLQMYNDEMKAIAADYGNIGTKPSAFGDGLGTRGARSRFRSSPITSS